MNNQYQPGPLAYTASMPAVRAPTGSMFGQLRAAAHAAAAGTEVWDDEYCEPWGSSTDGSSRPPSRPLLINSSQRFLSASEAIPAWMLGIELPSVSITGAGLALPAVAQAPLPQQQQYHQQPQQQPYAYPPPQHHHQHAQQQRVAAPPRSDPLTKFENLLHTFKTKAETKALAKLEQ